MSECPRRLPPLLLLGAVVGCQSPPGPPLEPSAEYLAEIEEFRASRNASLTAEDGWLTLVGLYWLEAGRNSFGSGARNDLVLADLPALDGMPEVLGTFLLEGGEVEVEVADGVDITLDGKPLRAAALHSDITAEPSVLELGSLQITILERGGRQGVRVRDRDSPERHRFPGIESYPVDPAWRIEARFEAYEPARSIRLPTILDWDVEAASPGAVVFEVDGDEHRLDALKSGSSLFLIFADGTNGEGTYGGGRYLYTELPGSAGRVEVDFNRAQSPPCVYTPYATCPLPPPQNRLPFSLEAGERYPSGP